MEIKLPQVEAAGGPLLVSRGKVQLAKTPNLQRWIVRLHLVNRSLRFLRFVPVRLRRRYRRLSGLLLWRRGRGRTRSRQHRSPAGRWPRLQVRDALLQLLNALEQYPDLLRLIWRGRTLPPCDIGRKNQSCAQQQWSVHTFHPRLGFGFESETQDCVLELGNKQFPWAPASEHIFIEE